MRSTVRRPAGPECATAMAAACFCAVTLLGCGRPTPGPVPHCAWAPGYLLIRDAEPEGEEDEVGLRKWAREVYPRVLRRAGYTRFWQLVEIVRLHAADAEFMVIAEVLPYSDDYYGWMVFVKRGDKYLLYAYQDAAVHVLTDDPHRGRRPPSGPWGAVRKVECGRDEAEAFLRALDEASFREMDESVFFMRQGLHTRDTWAIHIYQSHTEGIVTTAGEAPYRHYPYILGTATASSLVLAGDPLSRPPHDPIWQQYPAAEDKRYLAADHAKRYGFRLIVNGLLRLLHGGR